MGAQGGRHIVRVEEAGGHAVYELYHVAVPHGPRRAAHHQLVPPGILHDPPVIDVLEGVTGHLLLVGAATAVLIYHGVGVLVGVKPAGHGFAKDVLQSDLGTVGHLQGLALRDPRQPPLQAGLESTGHDLVVGPRAASRQSNGYFPLGTDPASRFFCQIR